VTAVPDEPWTPFTRAEVIKCDPGRDFYVAWSHIVEAPTWAGTRAEAAAEGCTPDRLDRADAHGSSWYLTDQFGHPQPGCWWGDHGLVAEQLGTLPRDRLADYAAAYCEGRLGCAYAMVRRWPDVSRAGHLARIKRVLYHDGRRRPRAHRRCKTCCPPRPLAVDGREYQRRLRNRRKRGR
jgi:hypothetical protein